MADAPDALKRLEEIEHPAEIPSKHLLAAHVSYLLRLTRALLASQGELMRYSHGGKGFSCRCPRGEKHLAECQHPDAMRARAERVRRGEV